MRDKSHSNPEKPTLVLPLEMRNSERRGTQSITLQPKSPKDVDEGGDGRRLGVALVTLKIDPPD